ncbi:hypothetical protein DdX_04420 [Ditylenchus destructor]|uniref:Uncharacterized protein n=1 Tax=Ditylenchus destructor TaxID=166010 RepID=A0AAD4NBG6_9BILA|nr:hypothetical protein DdX_04420 [Ditylenchus destructor]
MPAAFGGLRHVVVAAGEAGRIEFRSAFFFRYQLFETYKMRYHTHLQRVWIVRYDVLAFWDGTGKLIDYYIVDIFRFLASTTPSDFQLYITDIVLGRTASSGDTDSSSHGQFITWDNSSPGTVHHLGQFITWDNSSPGQFIT